MPIKKYNYRYRMENVAEFDKYVFNIFIIHEFCLQVNTLSPPHLDLDLTCIFKVTDFALSSVPSNKIHWNFQVRKFY